MTTLYLDCGMGAAGDMLAAALFELLPEDSRTSFLNTMNALLPGVSVRAERVTKCGVAGTHFAVSVCGESEVSEDIPAAAPEHHHLPHHSGHGGEHRHPEAAAAHSHGRNADDIRHIVAGLQLPDPVRENVLSVYRLLASAESEAHGAPVGQIHFHEVGELDAIADIAAVCLLLHTLAPDRVLASPVRVGFGQVRCAHGILPVPAPATAILLRNVPIYSGAIQGELCTPTGAALLKHFCTFGDMPPMAVSGIGYGMGTKDFEAVNCVRVMLDEAAGTEESVLELSCNLDDMTPEAVGFALERLWEGPVLDVFTCAIGMKKNRPGTLLTCLCRAEHADQVVRLLFLHTTTLGIRQRTYDRCTLRRTIRTAIINGETVRVKEASGWGVRRVKPEYEDVARYARANGISFSEASDIILRSPRE